MMHSTAVHSNFRMSSPRRRQQQQTDTDDNLVLNTIRSLPLLDDYNDGGSLNQSTNLLKPRSEQDLHLKTNNSDGMECSINANNSVIEKQEEDDDQEEDAKFSNNTRSSSKMKKKSPEEIQTIQKWYTEINEHSLQQLHESNENVKLLISRRKTLRDQQQRLEDMQYNNNTRDSLLGSSRAADITDVRGHGNSSPVGTTTSASSSSSSYEEDAIASQQSQPAVTEIIASHEEATTTAVNNEDEKDDDPLNTALELLELANKHRSWYQKNGRLIVFNSLPHLSLQGTEVVTQPHRIKKGASSLLFKSRSTPIIGMGEEEEEEENEEVLTLPPGCQVMAESAFVLDSYTLQLIHPPRATSFSKEDEDEENQTASNYSSSSSSQQQQLIFLKISSPTTGYILSSIHSYPLLLPGTPSLYTNSNYWYWRVSCQPDGAYVRAGLELNSKQLGILPYGTVCCVTKKVVNDMGLNRLKIEAYLKKNDGDNDVEEVKESTIDDDGDDREQSSSNRESSAASSSGAMTKYSGYISQFLNPLSGQRGNIVESISFPIPALYKVVNYIGCVIRSGVELSTTQIGYAPMGTILSIVGRSYSDHPGHNCIERLKLAGGGGWVSVTLNRKPPQDEVLLKMVGVDDTFDPYDPAQFHFDSLRKVMEELHANNSNDSTVSGNNNGASGNAGGSSQNDRRTFYRQRRSSYLTDLSEIGDDVGDDDTTDQQSNDDVTDISHSAAVPTLFRSGVVGGLSIDRETSTVTNAMDAIRESSSDNHHDHSSNPNRCLICLSDERTATIVHGETGHIACCLTCARILKARGDNCPVCRLPIDLVIQQFWA